MSVMRLGTDEYYFLSEKLKDSNFAKKNGLNQKELYTVFQNLNTLGMYERYGHEDPYTTPNKTYDDFINVPFPDALYDGCKDRLAEYFDTDDDKELKEQILGSLLYNSYDKCNAYKELYEECFKEEYENSINKPVQNRTTSDNEIIDSYDYYTAKNSYESLQIKESVFNKVSEDLKKTKAFMDSLGDIENDPDDFYKVYLQKEFDEDNDKFVEKEIRESITNIVLTNFGNDIMLLGNTTADEIKEGLKNYSIFSEEEKSKFYKIFGIENKEVNENKHEEAYMLIPKEFVSGSHKSIQHIKNEKGEFNITKYLRNVKIPYNDSELGNTFINFTINSKIEKIENTNLVKIQIPYFPKGQSVTIGRWEVEPGYEGKGMFPYDHSKGHFEKNAKVENWSQEKLIENINKTNFVYDINSTLNRTASNKEESNLVRFCKTPEVFGKCGLNIENDIYMRRGKIREVATPVEEGGHSISKEILMNIPSLLEKPALIYKSQSKEKSLVAIVDEINVIDNVKMPILVSIKPDVDDKKYNFEIVDANLITSLYGREKFGQFLENHKNSLLYIDNDKLDSLAKKMETTIAVKNIVPENKEKTETDVQTEN